MARGSRNTGGDDEGTVAVIEPDGQEKKLSSGWKSLEGVVWSPAGDEIWFTATRSGSSENLYGVSLSGKERAIANVPRRDVAARYSQRSGADDHKSDPAGHSRSGSRSKGRARTGLAGMGGAQGHEPRRQDDFVEEEGDGGGPDYTVFLRDMDGSPPVRIGSGVAQAISPDGKWVITKPATEGVLSLVPTGAGEARQLTHDNVSYENVRYLPDGKHVVATGIAPGHGLRDYLIDVNSGESEPVTPEGMVGPNVSPDGRSVAVQDQDGKWGIWPLDGSGLKLVPGLDAKWGVHGWSPDGASLYVVASHRTDRDRTTVSGGYRERKDGCWKAFGADLPQGNQETSSPRFSTDMSAYAYMHYQTISVGYVVRGLK